MSRVLQRCRFRLPLGSLDIALLDFDTPVISFDTHDGVQREDPGADGGRAALTPGAFSRPSFKHRIEHLFLDGGIISTGAERSPRYRITVTSDDSSSRALCFSSVKTGLPGSVLFPEPILDFVQ